jgi:hypothetical protein
MRSDIGILLIFVLALPPVAAQANDSSAALAAGGLVLTRQPDVRMVSEDLRISPAKVSIAYVFANGGTRDVDTLVAFPLPDIDTSRFYHSPVGTLTGDPVNFVGFRTFADGKPVKVAVEQRAFYRGRDVTAVLTRLGVPLNPITQQGNRRYQALPDRTWKALVKADLVDGEQGDYKAPHWTLRTKFYWRQQFPAGRTVRLDHSYQPVTGTSLASAQDFTGAGGEMVRDFCFDRATRDEAAKKLRSLTARERARDSSAGEAYANARATEYILSTARNWSGPIGSFRLTLDKMKPANILSLCWKGALRKTSPTLFEFRADNYTPVGDIKLMVLDGF